MEERYKSKIVVDLLVERMNETTEKKEILLMLRQNTGHADGMYDLPGGHLDPNEDIFNAMIREANEEIGIDINRKNMQICHIYHHFEKDMLKFVFKVSSYNGEITNNEPDKCAELKWFSIEELPSNIIEKIRLEIIDVYNNKFYNCD